MLTISQLSTLHFTLSKLKYLYALMCELKFVLYTDEWNLIYAVDI